MSGQSNTDPGVRARVKADPDHLALIEPDTGRQRTYAQLDDRARRLAHALHGLGVRRGDCVSIMVPNSMEFFEAAHACGRLGAVVVPINVHFKADETGWIVGDSGSTAVVVAPELVAALEGVPDVPRLTTGGDYERALASAPDGELDDEETIGDAWPTTMAYTSGTTGRPKGVAIGEHDFRRRAAGVAASGQRWNLGPEDVHLLVGPSYHSGPLFWAQMHLAFGGTVVVMRKWDAAEALALIERFRVTNTHMVPANFTRILELPDDVRTRHDLSSLKIVAHAAAPCPVPLKRAFMDFVGAEKVWEYFGASEGGGTVISPQEWLEHPGSVGKPFPGNEFVVLDDDGNELPPGEVGTIYTRPAESSFRYHNDDTKTAAAHRGGFFTVGDAGYFDADGYLYLTDRKSDMVISGGVNIYPREVEDALLRHPDVVDAAVLGVPDDRWGEVLLAVVQRRDGAQLDDDGVVGWVREQLADYKRPRIVEFVDEVPRDPNGKVRKPKLREAWLTRGTVT
ncbi:MAG: AMP-binding protein [Actinobacteria bacterium]|nr:AMP-binding protein [Actinomycetota bacterium]